MTRFIRFLLSSSILFFLYTQIYGILNFRIFPIPIHSFVKSAFSFKYALSDYPNGVLSLAISPDGNFLASGSSDQSLRVVSLETGNKIAVFDIHRSPIFSVAFTSNNQHIISGDFTGKINIVDLESRNSTQNFNGHLDVITSISTSPNSNIFATSSYDNTMKIWRLGSASAFCTIKEPSVDDISISPNGRFLASTSNKGFVRIWDISTCKKAKEIDNDNKYSKSLKDAVNLSTPYNRLSIDFSPNGNYLVGSSVGDSVSIWEVSSGEKLKVLYGHSAPVNSVSFSPNNKIVVSGSTDRSVKLWDWQSGQVLKTLLGSRSRVETVVISPRSPLLVSGGPEQFVRVWKMD